jgi:hypothetical protein
MVVGGSWGRRTSVLSTDENKRPLAMIPACRAYPKALIGWMPPAKNAIEYSCRSLADECTLCHVSHFRRSDVKRIDGRTDLQSIQSTTSGTVQKKAKCQQIPNCGLRILDRDNNAACFPLAIACEMTLVELASSEELQDFMNANSEQGCVVRSSRMLYS